MATILAREPCGEGRAWKGAGPGLGPGPLGQSLQRPSEPGATETQHRPGAQTPCRQWGSSWGRPA